MKKEYVKKGFKKVFGAAAKEAARQALWIVPALGVLSLIAAKSYELEAEEQEKVPVEEPKEEAPVEEHTNEETPVEESTDDVQVTGQCGDENLRDYESSFEEE